MSWARTISFFIYSNLFISFACVALMIQASIRTGAEYPSFAVSAFGFAGTYLEYNLHRFLVLARGRTLVNEPRYYWAIQNPRTFKVAFILVAVAGAVSFFLLSFREQIMAVISGIFVLLYSGPALNIENESWRLRSVPYAKIFVIAIVWTIITVWMPLAEYPLNNDFWLLSLQRFLFILAITLPFDMRDVEADRKKRIRTLPMLLGEKFSERLCYALLVMTIGTGFFLETNSLQLAATFITLLVTAFIIASKRLRSRPLYFYGFLDGTMFLWGFLSVLAEYFVE